MPRWVTGIPAVPGTPIDDVTPGTTSNATPASASASISSPPRAEDERVAALEPDDDAAGARVADHQVVNALLSIVAGRTGCATAVEALSAIGYVARAAPGA